MHASTLQHIFIYVCLPPLAGCAAPWLTVAPLQRFLNNAPDMLAGVLQQTRALPVCCRWLQRCFRGRALPPRREPPPCGQLPPQLGRGQAPLRSWLCRSRSPAGSGTGGICKPRWAAGHMPAALRRWLHNLSSWGGLAKICPARLCRAKRAAGHVPPRLQLLLRHLLWVRVPGCKQAGHVKYNVLQATCFHICLNCWVLAMSLSTKRHQHALSCGRTHHAARAIRSCAASLCCIQGPSCPFSHIGCVGSCKAHRCWVSASQY